MTALDDRTDVGAEGVGVPAVAALEQAATRLVSDDAAALSPAARLDTVARALGAIDRATAAVVELVGAAQSDPATLAAAGLLVPAWLRAVAGRTGGDAGMLSLAAERLTYLPGLRRLFVEGAVSWGVVRSVVLSSRCCNRDQLAWLDQAIAADAQHLERLEPDGIVDAVGELVDRARPDLAKAREERCYERQYLQAQPAFDGSGSLYAELDAESFTIVIEDLEARVREHDAASPDQEHEHEHEHDHEPEARPEPKQEPGHAFEQEHEPEEEPDHDHDHEQSDEREQDSEPEPAGVGRGRALAEALVALCRQRAGGAPAKPSLLVVTDIETLEGTNITSQAAQLLWRANRGPVRLSKAGAQRLACDCWLRPILGDKSLPLGAGFNAQVISPGLRATLVVRDGGCRFPGCHAPAHICEGHHIIHWVNQGPTVLENLILLCRAHHRAVHVGGWRVSLHADGAATWKRRGIERTTLARGDRRIKPAGAPPAARSRRRRAGQLAEQPAADTHPPPEPMPF